MSDLINTSFGTAQKSKRVCHVAYTLNNYQPVMSTIIGDQPVIYMDHECDYEEMDFDDGILSQESLSHIERELDSLKKDIDALERFQKDFSQDSEVLIGKMSDAKSDMFSVTPASTFDMDQLLSTLEKSRLASSLLSAAQLIGFEISLSQNTQSAELNMDSKTIMVSPALSLEDQVLLSVRELRRLWQVEKTGFSQILNFLPDDVVFVNRLSAADLAITQIRTAWEMQLSGERAVWERVENSSMADLGRSFACEAFRDFRTINSGAACAAVFETWFLSERCRTEDKKIIQAMLSDYKGYISALDHGLKSVTVEMVAAFGEMPFGKNYLADHAHNIAEDTLFTDVRDRSNANFLWFIKFEHTFRETEQELQTHGYLHTEEVPRSVQSKQKPQRLDHEQSGENVIMLDAYQKSACEQQPSRVAQRTGDIIYLKRRSRTD